MEMRQIMNKIFICTSILGFLIFLQACSIGASSGYCESRGSWSKVFDWSLNKCNYKKAGVCDSSLDILSHREATLKKSYKDVKCEED